jgi:hypothetical protein
VSADKAFLAVSRLSRFAASQSGGGVIAVSAGMLLAQGASEQVENHTPVSHYIYEYKTTY